MFIYEKMCSYWYYYCCVKWYNKETQESKDWHYPRFFRREPTIELQKNPMHMTDKELFDYIIG